MVGQERGKEDEPKLEFDSAGQAIAYVSLDQTRVVALQHARDNRDFYGRYAAAELAWEVLSTEGTEDYYEVHLSYRPGREFRGRAGIEHFTIDKAGPIELLQIVREPRPSNRFLIGIVAFVAVAIVGAAIGTLFASGVLTTDSTPLTASVAITSDAPARLVSPDAV